LYTFNSMSSYI